MELRYNNLVDLNALIFRVFWFIVLFKPYGSLKISYTLYIDTGSLVTVHITGALSFRIFVFKLDHEGQ